MEYQWIRTPSELLAFLPAIGQASLFAVDTETTGLDPNMDKLRLIQLAVPSQPVLLIDCHLFLPSGRRLLCDIFSTKAVKVFHNAKFDLQFLMQAGISASHIFDTMLAAQLLRSFGGSPRASLAAVSQHYLGIALDKAEQTGDWSQDLTESQAEYAALDAGILLKLYEVLSAQLSKYGMERVADIEFQCVPAIAHTEYYGIHLDLSQWEPLCQAMEQSYEAALKTLYTYSGTPTYQLTLWGGEEALDVNFESNPYVLKLLRKNGIPVTSTSRRSLAPYHAHPLVKALADYRRYSKLLSTFLHPLPSMIHPVTGRLHPKYGQIGAWSGRMSCGSPNIQQIPRGNEFRQCFTAPKGKKLILADYSQIELRVAAQLSGDTRMKNAYQNGEDLHTLTASLLTNTPPEQVTKSQRQAAKAVNFGLIYGMGAAGLAQYSAQSYGVSMSLEEAQHFRDAYFQIYPGISWWHHDIQESHPTEGSSLTGRRFLFSQNTGLSGLYNTPVQSTAADILKNALGLLMSRLQGTEDKKIVGIVHDEILMEVPEAEAAETAVLLQSTMEQAAKEILPDIPCVADAKAADNWAGK